MDYTSSDSISRQIAADAASNRFDRCFEGLRQLAGHPATNSYGPRINALEGRFFYMLRYLMGAPADADVNAEKTAMALAITRLADTMNFDIHAADDPSLFWSTVRFVRMRPDDSLESLMADYVMEQKRLSTDVTALTDTRSRKELEQIASDIFNLLWTDLFFDEDVSQPAMAFITDADIAAYDRRLWIAAAGLGLVRRWNSNRAVFLATLARDPDIYISSTAKVWLATAIDIHADNDDLRDVISAFVHTLKPALASDIVDIIIEKIRALGAGDLSRRFSRDMGSELGELGRRFSNGGADMDFSARTDAAMADMPQGTFDKLRQFNEAAMAGDDVLYGTLGAMRSSPFFGQVSNWFLPFHPENSALAPVVDSEGIALAEVLTAMPMLTDGDKYALVLSAAEAPESMRRRMLESTAGPLASLFDDGDAREALDSMNENMKANRIYNLLVRDIFRFATRFGKAAEVFGRYATTNRSLEFLDTEITGDRREKALRLMTANGNAADALEIFDTLYPDPTSDDLVLKAEICIAADRPDDAFNFYLEARLTDRDNRDAALGVVRYAKYGAWTDDLAGILEPFADSAGDDPEFLELAGLAALYSRDFEGAERYFHHLAFVSDSRATRPQHLLAATKLMAGDYDGAADIFEKIAPVRADQELNVDAAVALWLAGRRPQALDVLADSVASDGFDAVARDIRHRLLHYYRMGGTVPADAVALLPAALRYRTGPSPLGPL